MKARITQILLVISLIFAFGNFSPAQTNVRIIIPPDPVVIGESFRIQFVYPEKEFDEKVIPKDFPGFRIVAGPDIYNKTATGFAGKSTSYKNVVYTLVPLKKGKFVIGKQARSKGVIIEVVSKDEAEWNFEKDNSSAYYLKPGENVYQKIRQNLFLKVLVDKKVCYIGEPILATFKLYSRLESQSDIVKNPGFYGFTVVDMVSLNDKLVSTEKINGKIFDVHTIRKVQLYPLRSGNFTIDPMELKNKIEFSRSAVYKKTEQVIKEGMPTDNRTSFDKNNKTIIENEIYTEPVAILVKPIPEISRPGTYNGAVGVFTISASLSDKELVRNEQGFLEVSIKGNGNFIQLNPLPVRWPKELEGFDPIIDDSLDRTQSPIIGRRTFRYPLISAIPGEFNIPPIEFSFFNPVIGEYRTVSTSPQHITIRKGTEKTILPAVSKEKSHKNSPWFWVIGGLIIIAFAGTAGFRFLKAKKKKHSITEKKEETETYRSIEEILMSPGIHLQNDDQNFYSALHQAIWDYFCSRLKISGSDINKEWLGYYLDREGIDQELIKNIKELLEECETTRFTNAAPKSDKDLILRNTKRILKKIEASLF